MILKLTFEGLTDVGREREHNEDAFLVMDEYLLAIVADGMGGHNAGDVASSMAIDRISTFFKHTESEDSTWPFHFDTNLSYEENRLIGGIQVANKSIYHQSSQPSAQEGMGTTVVSLCFSARDLMGYVGHVGDSRCYLLREGQLSQVTRDHSLLNDYLDAMPDMSEERKQAIPTNVITRALGMQSTVQVDLSRVPVERGDLFLLCSDGLSGMVPDEDIESTIRGATDDLPALAQELVDMANKGGGEDNITVVLVHVDDVGEEDGPEEQG
jgi:protein phosphatase